MSGRRLRRIGKRMDQARMIAVARAGHLHWDDRPGRTLCDLPVADAKPCEQCKCCYDVAHARNATLRFGAH